MKFLLPVIIAVMALFAPLSLSAIEKNDEQHIKSIFYQKNNGREVVQIRLSGKVVPKVFELEGEKPRVVLDFVATGYQPNKIRTIKAGGILVSKIRVGLHAKPIAKTRVVIDMVEGEKYTFSQEYTAADTLFRITFRSPQTQTSKEKKDPSGLTEQENNAEPAAFTGDENRNVEPPILKEEVQESVDEKSTEESISVVKSLEKIPEKTDSAQEREDDVDAAKKEGGSLEDKNEDYVVSVKPEIPEIEDENTQILLDVTYESNTNGNEMVLFHLNGFYPPIVYSAESGELLVVCDFLNAELRPDGIPVVRQGGRYIRQIKVEPYQQPKKVRVVIELADGYTYDVKQVFFKEDNLFAIVLNSLGEKKKKN